MSVTAVIGAQYGSEGKGVIVNHIARRYDVHVRTGGPNAGHSFYHSLPGGTEPKLYKMQAIPCGWTNPDAALVIGAGALVNPRILKEELDMLPEDVKWRLMVDSNAGVLDDSFHEAEGGIHGEIHQRIGSTGEGVGAAREARMSRDTNRFKLFHQIAGEYGLQSLEVKNTAEYLHDAHLDGQRILLEGTQGTSLSLIHGPWPFVTSNDTNAAQLCADAGIPPQWCTEIIAVARTYPIRVAGNSGPLKGEMSWEEMSRRVGRPVEERTTVTKKVRRIGVWDPALIEKCVTLNDPTSFALTFADYLNPEDEGKTEYDDLSNYTQRFIEAMEKHFGIPVKFVGTGGQHWNVIER